MTSASSALGSTLATHFVKLGAKVILCDRDQQGLVDTYWRCHAISNQVAYFHLNDFSPDSIERLLDMVEQKFQRAPDVLINNLPSSPLPSLIDEKPSEQFIQQLGAIASSLFNFSHACSVRMRQRQTKGVIVNVVCYNAPQDRSGIESANSMVSGFTQSWAKELTPFNIRVGGVVPQVESANDEAVHWSEIREELIRNTEYIVANEYFSGRVMSA
ncbi:SDR family oxidoreductase [Vibrio metoecus]|uniref:SDR family oxidoreductase n=1 Tax=Vibrio metoecus TaxID=1481663 RepID=UPI001F2EB451|nr:SDR family oxidoreductase [Vibrio metoecus]WKY94389.1 SDR family oxidoreductase [Vibrio metoecus]